MALDDDMKALSYYGVRAGGEILMQVEWRRKKENVVPFLSVKIKITIIQKKKKKNGHFFFFLFGWFLMGCLIIYNMFSGKSFEYFYSSVS